MDKELKDKWVAALRSGEYKQGQGYLHNKARNTYCCIGVLCAVSNRPEWDGEAMNNFYGWVADSDLHLVGLMPNQDRPLMGMNDGESKYNRIHSFAEIADYIEENL